MPRVSPQEAADDWASRLGQSGAKMTAGANRVTKAPGASAAEQVERWAQETIAAKDKWKRNVAAVSLDEWKRAYTTLGVNRVAAGATAKKDKMASFLAEFFPHLDALDSKLAAMPSTTFEQRVNRAVTAMQHNHTFKRSR